MLSVQNLLGENILKWKKGQSGNPEGRRAEKENPTVIIRQKIWAKGPELVDILVGIAQNTEAKDHARVVAVKVLFEYAYAKPPQEFIVGDESIEVRNVDKVSSAQLIKMIKDLEERRKINSKERTIQ